MANLNIPDQSVQIVTTAEPGYDAIRVPIPMSTIRPGTAIAAGTTFDAAAVPLKFRAPEGWGSYVAGRRVTEPPNIVWQHFVRALPTTPTVAEAEFHPIFGRTFEHTYDDLISNSRPDRGDAFTISTDTSLLTFGGDTMGFFNGTSVTDTFVQHNVRIVLDCTETDQGQGLCEVKVRTVENAEAIIEEDKGVDEETGELIPEEATHTLTSTRPDGSDADSEGYATLVTRQGYNWYVSTRSKVITGPVNEANATTWTKTERTPVYWPPVLAGWQWVYAVNTSETYINKLLSYTMKAAYTGDVQVTYREWWQSASPAPLTPVEMVPTGINIPRIWSPDISIPECLHAAFSVSEPLYVRDSLVGPINEREVTSTVPATAQTDWPAYVVKRDVSRLMGGYKITERTVYRPQTTVAGVTITQTGWTALSGTGFEGYA